MQQNKGPGFFEPGQFRVIETGELFKGVPKVITIGDNTRFYDTLGREMIPLGQKEPEPPTLEQLFYNGTWKKQ